MITIEQYWMGRDKLYPADLTPAVAAHAQTLVERVNEVLSAAAAENVSPSIDSITGTSIASGWRPSAVNDATSNAGKMSKHIVGQAVDLRDSLADRALARWCLRNLDVLEANGLWMEDPQWTPTWVHLQWVPPGSAKRVYVPSTAPALAAALPEQQVA